MKIEKISDTQIKFILNKNDLVEKDIKLSELAYGSEKTQDLFREMMEQAYHECGFEAENTPLMIEAIPVTVDSIMIIVTKVSGNAGSEAKFNMLPRNKEFGRLRKNAAPDGSRRMGKANIFIYSFRNIEEASELSVRLAQMYGGESSMYKYNGEYFLIFENYSGFNITSDFEAVLGEYGQKRASDVITKYHLIEHGERIIAKSAVQVLARI